MMPQRRVGRYRIQRIGPAGVQDQQDRIAVEEPLEIRLSVGDFQQSLSVTMRTPGEDFQLAAGFLLSEGIVRSLEDIERISYCLGPDKLDQEYNILNVRLRPHVPFDPERFRRNVYTTSSCGICGKASLEALQIQGCPQVPQDTPVIPIALLYQLFQCLQEVQPVFAQTGGLHAAALFDTGGKLLGAREDVGRHNTVDKLIGEQLLANQLPLSQTIIVVSGRAGFEILQKALMASIPIVASVGAPSSLAVDLALEFGLTLVGFLRSDRCNIYAGAERIDTRF